VRGALRRRRRRCAFDLEIELISVELLRRVGLELAGSPPARQPLQQWHHDEQQENDEAL